MISPFSISESTANTIASTVVYVASNVTNYAVSNVMDFFNSSEECFSDDNTVKMNLNSFVGANVMNHMAFTGPANSASDISGAGIGMGFGVAAMLGLIACCGCCAYKHTCKGDGDTYTKSTNNSLVQTTQLKSMV